MGGRGKRFSKAQKITDGNSTSAEKSASHDFHHPWVVFSFRKPDVSGGGSGALVVAYRRLKHGGWRRGRRLGRVFVVGTYRRCKGRGLGAAVRAKELGICLGGGWVGRRERV